MEWNDALLEWYRPRRRSYPWRRGRRDPYRVLVSEVMLQQTQAPRVAAVFESFVERFPTVESLARAPLREVLAAWSGLGYNRRALALSRAARAIVRDHGGRVPCDPGELRRLPGVGPYTAAAVAAIGFGVAVPAVDTNVARVVARARLGVDPSEAPRGRIRDGATEWLNGADPAGWNQAVMDLGREVCRPRPRCDGCPLAPVCRFRQSGRTAATRPRRQTAFEGSTRQVRGAVVRALVEAGGRASIAALHSATGEPAERLAAAVRALEADGIVQAGPAGRPGLPGGRVRLAD